MEIQAGYYCNSQLHEDLKTTKEPNGRFFCPKKEQSGEGRKGVDVYEDLMSQGEASSGKIQLAII